MDQFHLIIVWFILILLIIILTIIMCKKCNGHDLDSNLDSELVEGFSERHDDHDRRSGYYYDYYDYFNNKYCDDCGHKSRRSCSSCLNCGFCVTYDGYGECVPGDESGPYFREDCQYWEFNNPWARYPYSSIFPSVTPPQYLAYEYGYANPPYPSKFRKY
jgi:hypothetical protein